MKTIKKQGAQGDLFIRRIDEIPENANAWTYDLDAKSFFPEVRT